MLHIEAPVIFNRVWQAPSLIATWTQAEFSCEEKQRQMDCMFQNPYDSQTAKKH